MDLQATYRLLPFVARSFQVSERAFVIAQADMNNCKARGRNPLALVNLVKLIQQRSCFPDKTGRRQGLASGSENARNIARQRARPLQAGYCFIEAAQQAEHAAQRTVGLPKD